MNNDVTTATSPLEHTGADTPTPEPAEAGLQEAFRLPVKFNKQDYHLSLEEATAYAQKGMKYESVEPMLDRLKDLAQQHGLGVREMVEALCQETATPTATVPAVSVEERLAEEYLRLTEACPDAPSFETLPDAVVRTAVDEGVALMDAYLRYDYRERRRIAEAEAAAKAAGARSAGAQHTALEAAPDPAIEAMMAGVRRQAPQ